MASAPRPRAESTGGHISYRSAQAMLGLWLIMPPTAGLSLYLSWNAPPAWARVLVLAATLLPLALLGRLVIEIRGGLLQWRYGFFGWPRWRLAIDDIVTLRQARGPAWHAGIQFNGRQRVYTASLASPAVEITLRDGRRVLLGSPEPERLAQFIRARSPHEQMWLRHSAHTPAGGGRQGRPGGAPLL